MSSLFDPSTSNPFTTLKNSTIVSNATSNINNFYQNAVNNKTLYIGLFAVIIFTIITAYLLYAYLGRQLFSKIKITVQDTKLPIMGTTLSKFKTDELKNNNGNRRSISFWIYINDMNKFKDLYKNVICLSGNGDDFQPYNSSPHIFLDKTNNTMFIRFSKTSESEKHLNNNEQLHEYLQQGISIDYIPLQRWVHICIVCNSSTFKTTLYAYVDAELVKTISHGDKFKLSNINSLYDKVNEDSNYYHTKKSELNNIDISKTGFLYVGGSINNIKYGGGFSGLISLVSIYNYELNQQDINKIYNDGPISGFLAKLGLGLYGVRNPIYKL